MHGRSVTALSPAARTSYSTSCSPSHLVNAYRLFGCGLEWTSSIGSQFGPYTSELEKNTHLALARLQSWSTLLTPARLVDTASDAACSHTIRPTVAASRNTTSGCQSTAPIRSTACVISPVR